MNKIVKIEALRGLVAMYVMLCHTLQSEVIVLGFDISFINKYGNIGVLIFFILSGFVIQYSYSIAKDKSFKNYFLKRFFRIYIPLIFVFVLNTVIVFIQGDYDKIKIFELIGTLLMLQDNAGTMGTICHPYLANLPLWSLSFEWWYYMLFFVVVNKLGKKAPSFIYIVSSLAAISYMFYPIYLNRVLMFLSFWWLGADMARAYLSDGSIAMKKIIKPLSVILFCVVIIRINLFLYYNNVMETFPVNEYKSFLGGFLIVLVGLIWYKLKFRFFKYTIGLFEPFAKISYMIYISHWFLVSYATYLNFIPNSVLRYTLYFVILFSVCYLVEVIIYPKLNRYLFSKLYKNPYRVSRT